MLSFPTAFSMLPFLAAGPRWVARRQRGRADGARRARAARGAGRRGAAADAPAAGRRRAARRRCSRWHPDRVRPRHGGRGGRRRRLARGRARAAARGRGAGAADHRDGLPAGGGRARAAAGALPPEHRVAGQGRGACGAGLAFALAPPAFASAATWSGFGRLAQARGHGASMWGAAASGLPLRLREAAGGASSRAPLGQDTLPYPKITSCGACAGRQPWPQHGGAGHRLAHLAPGGGRGGGRAGRRGARRRRRGRGGRVRRRPAARRGAAARRGRAGARAGARQGAGGRRAGERTAALSASVAHALSRGAAALACSGTPRWCARGDAKPYRVQER